MRFDKYRDLSAHSLTACTSRIEKLVADGKLVKG